MTNEVTALNDVYNKVSSLIPALEADKNENTINSVKYWQGNMTDMSDNGRIATNGVTVFVVCGDRLDAEYVMPKKQAIRYNIAIELWLVCSVYGQNFNRDTAIESPQSRLLAVEQLIFEKFKEDENIDYEIDINSRFAYMNDFLEMTTRIRYNDIITTV